MTIYKAITIKDNIITGVHESALPFEPDVFDGNPWLSGHELRQVKKGDWREGVRIECYDEDGKQKDIVWCIEQGYMPLPEGKELIDGELVDKAVTPEDAPPTLRERLEAAEAAAQVAEDSQKAARVMFRALAQTDVISVEDALDNETMFPAWNGTLGKEVASGIYLRYKDGLYRVKQKHTVQAHHPPGVATAALYTRIQPETGPEAWATGQSYAKGVEVVHRGGVWLSGVDNNTWEPGSPGIYKNIWKRVRDA